MGSCCSSESSENFQGEGRTLGAAPATAPPRTQNASAAAPKQKISSAGGQTLGGGQGDVSAKAAAARAAEERAKSSQGKGKLARQLDAQKAQTQTETLAQSARENVAHRDADASAQARNWD